MPVVSLSDQKDIALEITVTNQNGDDAHEAALVASFPPSLSYSASRSAPNAVSLHLSSSVTRPLSLSPSPLPFFRPVTEL